MDRAGAAAETVHAQVMKQLEQLHPEITGDKIFYRLWAEHVIRQPVEERDDWLQHLPPRELIWFFSAAPSELSKRAETAKDSMAFGMEMLNVMEAQISEWKRVRSTSFKACDCLFFFADRHWWL